MKTIAAAVLILVAAPALAKPIPKVDIDQTCRTNKITQMTMHMSPEARYAECFQGAQANYDKLKTIWGTLTEANQQRCINSFYLTADIYQKLVWCVGNLQAEQELERSKKPEPQLQVPKREFRY